MAIFKLFATKDSTIYSLFPQMNTGLDEIIEATTTTFGIDIQPAVSRLLIAFDQTEINNLFSTKISSSNWSASLKLFHAKMSGLYTDSIIECYPISGSWNMGIGQYLDVPIQTNGTSWIWQDMSGSQYWNTLPTQSYVTASYYNSRYSGGGTWYTGSSNAVLVLKQTQSFSYHQSFDLNLNVTDIIKAWYSSSNNIGSDTVIQNNGFILKQPTNKEFVNNINAETEMKFFSTDTHTIFPPQLEFKWDNYIWNTGSSTNTVITTSNLNIDFPNNIGTYYNQSLQRFRVNAKPQYPVRVFQTSSLYTTNYYLPTSSYYAIKDLDTNEFIIDFDTTFTKINADSTSNYFDIYMDGLQPERFYKILIQTTIDNSTIVLDEDVIFKVIQD